MADEPKMVIMFEIESRLDQVRLVRAALTGVLDHLRVTEPDILSLELAVTEIVNNCVEHGYGGKQDERVRVKMEVRGQLVQVDVIDNAPAFPEEARARLFEPARDVEPEFEGDWPVRGRGIEIVKQIVDSIALKCEDSQNVMTLCKNVVIRED